MVVKSTRVLRLLAPLLVLATSGCAPTPPERPVDPGERFAFRTARTPYSAAICIGRNAKGHPGVAAEERLLGETSMEVVVRSGGGSGGTLAVAQIVRDGVFSSVSILVTALIRAERGSFARALVAGC